MRGAVRQTCAAAGAGPAPLDVLQHRLLVRLDDLLGQNKGRHVGHLRDLVARQHFLDVLDRLHADQIGQLRDRGVEPSRLDRLDGVAVAVDADDDDLVLAGRPRRFDCAERHVVIGAEDGDEVGIALQRVVGDVGGLQTVPVARQRGDDVEAGRLLLQFFGEPPRALLPGDVAGKAFDHQHRTFRILAERADQIIRAFRARSFVVRADMKGNINPGLLGDRRIEVVVEVDDRNFHPVRLFEAWEQDGRIDRCGDHRHGLLLQHGVARVELRLRSLVGFDRLQEDLDAGVLGALIHALLHRAPERVGQRLHQDAIDGLVFGVGRRRGEAEHERRDRRGKAQTFQHDSLPVLSGSGLRDGFEPRAGGPRGFPHLESAGKFDPLDAFFAGG